MSWNRARTTWIDSVLARAERRPLLFVLALVLVLYLPWLEAAPVSGAIESNRLVAARDMLRTGDWVVPRLDGKPYLAKPPFQYWLIELVSLPFGDVTLWSARAVSALSVVALAVVVAAWGRRVLSARVGVIAGVAVALSGVILEKGVLAELEVVLALSTTAALVLLWESVRSERRGRLLAALGGLALGSAILTKGPVPLLAFACATGALVWGSPGRRRRCAVTAGAMFSIGLVTAVPWIALLSSRVGTDAMLEVFGFEIFHRLGDPGVTNAEPFWYYAPATLSALFPVALLLPAAAAVLRASRGEPRRVDLAAFLVAWCVGTTLLLGLSGGKEVRYLISAAPAWCLLVAWGLEEGERPGWLVRYLRGLGILARWVGMLSPLLALGLGIALGQASVGLVAGGLLAAAVLLARRPARAALPDLLALGCALLGLKVAWAKGYLAERTRTDPVMRMGAEVAEHVPAGAPLHVLGRYSSALDFAVDRPLAFVEPEELEGGGAPELVLVGPRGEAPGGAQGWTLVGSWELRSKPYRLLRRTATDG